MTNKQEAAADDLRQQVLQVQVAADHPALELLNTIPHVAGRPVDLWISDADVGDWLVRQGWHSQATIARAQTGGLLQAGRALREMVRDLVVRRKQGQPVDPAPLNALMALASSHLELVTEHDGQMRLVRRRGAETPQDLLAPVAESAADLLATGDFNLVRKCEDATCTLWFYDRTKSHRRRWCTMAVCGNRSKVAAFRQRQQR